MKSLIQNCRIVGTNVPVEQYLAFRGEKGDPGFVMSRSELKRFAVCPSKWRRHSDRPESKSLRWGTLLDYRVSGELDRKTIQPPATYINSKKQEEPWTLKSPTCRKWVEEKEQQGLLVCNKAELQELEIAYLRFQQDPELAGLLNRCVKQVMIVAEWKDVTTGLVIPVKALLDLVPPVNDPLIPKSIGDLKTAKSAEPRRWRRAVFEEGYDLQAWEYLTLYSLATGEERNTFFHVIQENTPPYEPAKRILSEEFLRRGEAHWKSAMELYCQCLKRNQWPSWDDGSGEMKYHGFSFVHPEPWMMEPGAAFDFESDQSDEGADDDSDGEIVP